MLPVESVTCPPLPPAELLEPPVAFIISCPEPVPMVKLLVAAEVVMLTVPPFPVPAAGAFSVKLPPDMDRLPAVKIKVPPLPEPLALKSNVPVCKEIVPVVPVLRVILPPLPLLAMADTPPPLVTVIPLLLVMDTEPALPVVPE